MKVGSVLVLWISLLFLLVVSSVKVLAQELVIYSGRAERLIKPFLDAFTNQTGIKIKLHSGGTVELYNRLVAEGERSPADLFITVDGATLERARIAGLLHPMSSEIISQNVPPQMRAPDNSWVGLTLRVRVIAYNPNKIKPGEIKTFQDLLHPKYKGRVGVRTGSNIYPQSHLAMMIAEMGETKAERFMRDLLKNVGDKIYPSDMKIVEAIVKGEIDAGIVNHYYVYLWLRDNPQDSKNLSIVIPPKTAYNISGIGLLKSSKNKEMAIKLVEFLLSPEIQRQFAELNREYPINPKVKHHPDMYPRDKISLSDVTIQRMGQYLINAVDMIDRIGYR